MAGVDQTSIKKNIEVLVSFLYKSNASKINQQFGNVTKSINTLHAQGAKLKDVRSKIVGALSDKGLDAKQVRKAGTWDALSKSMQGVKKQYGGLAAQEVLHAANNKLVADSIVTVGDKWKKSGKLAKIQAVASRDFTKSSNDAARAVQKQGQGFVDARINTRRFRYEWLGVLFAGEAIKRQFSGVVQASKNYTSAIKATNKEVGEALDNSAVWNNYISATTGAMKAFGGDGTAVIYILGNMISVIGQALLAYYSFKLAFVSIQAGIQTANAKLHGNTAAQLINKQATEIAARATLNRAAAFKIDAAAAAANTAAINANTAANGRLSWVKSSALSKSKRGHTGGISTGKLAGTASLAGLAISMIGMSGAAGDASDSMMEFGNALLFVGIAAQVLQGILGAGGITAALTGITASLGGLSTALTGAATAIATFIGVSTGILVVILAVIAIVAAIIMFKDQIWEFLVGITTWIDEVKNAIFQFGFDIGIAALKWGKDLIDNFVKGIKDGIDGLLQWLGKVMEEIGKAIGFDNAANDNMAKRWGTDMSKFFGKGANDGMGKAMDRVRGTVNNRVKHTADLFSWLGKQMAGFWALFGGPVGGMLGLLSGLQFGTNTAPIELPDLAPFIEDLGQAGAVFLENFPWVELSGGIANAFGLGMEAFDFTGASEDFALAYTTALSEIQWESHLVPMATAAGKVMSDKDWTGAFGNSSMGLAIEAVFNDADWAGIFETVAKALSDALGTPEFLDLITKLIEAVGKAMDGVDWSTHFTKAGEVFGQAVKDMPWHDIMLKVSDALKLAVEEIDVSSWEAAFANMGAAVGDVIKNIPVSDWKSMFANMTVALLSLVADALSAAWDAFWGSLGWAAQQAAQSVGWYKQGGIVPGNGAQPAMVHGGEMILPAGITNALLSLLGGVSAPGLVTPLYSSNSNKTESTNNSVAISMSDINIASGYDVNSMMDEIESRLKARGYSYS